MKLFAVLTTLVALSLAFPALAAPCAPRSEPTAKVGEDLYLVHEMCDRPCVPLFAVYEETNGFDGLQRKDRNADNTCHGSRPADERII